jgi:hypothetical protein
MSLVLLLRPHSSEPDTAFVPDVVGLSQAAAVSAIEAELLVAVVETAYDALIAAGIVLSQDPAADEEVAIGSDVTITVSLGPAPVLTITTTSLPNARLNGTYHQTVQAANGTAPYSFAVTSGSLPNGLTLHAGTGVIDGSATVENSFAFTITVTDNVSATDTQDFTITVVDGEFLNAGDLTTVFDAWLDVLPDPPLDLNTRIRDALALSYGLSGPEADLTSMLAVFLRDRQ